MNQTKEKSIKKLAENLGFPESKRLIGLLNQLYTEEEAQIASLLPGEIEELCVKTTKTVLEMETILEGMYQKGLLLISNNQNGKAVFVFDQKPGRFMDTILFDPRYRQRMSKEFFDDWKSFFNEEMIPTHKYRQTQELPFRVITVIGEEIKGKQEILPCEQIEKIIQNAKHISIQDCPCRVRERNCDNPLETCISLDKQAEYMQSRGIGRLIDKKEALKILRKTEKYGLVHTVDNNVNPTVICNCCDCCCVFLKAITVFGQNDVIARSRYRAAIDTATCTNCGSCEMQCKFHAIKSNGESFYINLDQCYGCGHCLSLCSESAISLILKEPPNYIPKDRTTFFQGVDNTFPKR